MSEELEPGRPDPGFMVVIVRDDTEFVGNSGGVSLARALQDVYDIAVNSMDFGSGFLGTEEVHNLRILGKAIGAGPLHYKDTNDGSSWCAQAPEWVVTAGSLEATFKGVPVGTVRPAVPCNCGALDV